ncbi:phosphatidylinositol N-acetylglucosaminyltransferase-domain-containing protein [Delphinella strobiligena]|nr:phosphatidylinositol N-acetylglucosaminyltransferase-domain-containing protein [Delphinella strobiligena]
MTMPAYEAPETNGVKKATIRSPSSSHLRPEDAFYAYSPPRKQHRNVSPIRPEAVDNATGTTATSTNSRRKRDRRGRSASGRRKGAWKKLLWVKQPYPDNYTDEETFLDHLQRNPRLRPYEFWTLVADSTIIVQHVGSVIIFICCFTVISQERVSPVSVVTYATIATVLGWVLRDYWMGQEEAAQALHEAARQSSEAIAEEQRPQEGPLSPVDASAMPLESARAGLGILNHVSSNSTSRRPSLVSPVDNVAQTVPLTGHPTGASTFATFSYYPPYERQRPTLSARNQERLATAKSAILIYCALLGLSPILKSLTKSTSSDSIWAMSSWLMIINIFTFDYGAGVEAKFPASLSTNAALSASTVLASRLPSTTHVFSLTLFSIEVFGLFPVYRRHLRHVSWRGHLVLTALVVMGAGGGLCMTISRGGWKAAVIGAILGTVLTCLAMGLTSWWLIGLQRYKNEIHGPWDPARPVIRRHWGD